MTRPPTMNDVPQDVDARLLYLQVLLLRYDLNGKHAEDHEWLGRFRAVVTDIWRASVFTVKVAAIPAALVILGALLVTQP